MGAYENYWKRLQTLENNVCTELSELLDKTDGISSEGDKWEFFNFTTIAEMEITQISWDGKILDGYQKGNTIRSLVNSGTILLADVISLVGELREVKDV